MLAYQKTADVGVCQVAVPQKIQDGGRGLVAPLTMSRNVCIGVGILQPKKELGDRPEGIINVGEFQ